MTKWILPLGFVLFAGQASARVFQIGKESVAPYLRGQYQTAGQKDEPFAPSGGTGATYETSYASNMAYEFGLIYATPIVSWRFGLEILKPADLKEVKASDAGGTTLYTVSNNISGYVPKIGLEITLKSWTASKLYANVDYGYATVNVQNSYSFTSAGTAQYAGMADFREEVEGVSSMIESSLGFETLLSDTTTIVIDAGYRQLQFDSLTHKQAVKTFQGDVAKGSAAKNTDGSDRTLNMSGAFASVWLRFWVN